MKANISREDAVVRDAGMLEEIATEIRRLTKPASRPTLRRELRKSNLRIPDVDLSTALDELVRQGRAFQHPVSKRTRNASPCHFSKTPLAYTEDLLLAQIRAQDVWSEAALRKHIPKAYQNLWDEAIGDLLNSGRLFEQVQGRSRILSRHPPRPLEEVKQAILDLCSTSQRPLTRVELKAALPAGEQSRFTETLTALIADGRLFQVQRGFVVKRPPPTAFLTAAQHRALQAILARLNEHRPEPLSFKALGAFLDGATPVPASTVDEDLTEELLIRWYGEDLPRRDGLRSMPIPWTWRRYVLWCEERAARPNSDLFHDLLQRMAAARRIAVTPHDTPHTLPPEELAVLRRDRDRADRINYYWTVLA